MPRNASGTYTLPLPPVISDTIIESVWANTSLDDLAQSMTDSLDRYGRGAMVAPFRLVDGTVGAPGFAWQAETGTGFYRESAGVMSVAVQGAKRGTWSAAGLSIIGGVIATMASGVGTTTPTQLFQVGKFDKTGIMYQRISGQIADIYLGQSASDLFGLDHLNTAYVFQDAVNNCGLALGTLGANTLSFGTNNLERMRIDAAGRVDITGSLWVNGVQIA